MNKEIQQFLNNFFPDLSKPPKPDLEFMDEDELYEWLHQRLLLFIVTKDIQIGAVAIQQWCQRGHCKSGIPLVHQFLTIMAGQQLKKNPKMADEIINLMQDDEEKSKLVYQLQQTQQQQVSLQVSDSPKVLKAQPDKKDPSIFQNILTALRCWDKKQK
ncbi:unnamed protein product [Paramecium octaurelia]|uniref:Uncharacterized protein n=1 Tax=Paramecium octaurelia TaxID=43137 RepID=A0A8S1S4D5_PAROT|nr:unnamed protein product [Paramecium octaurelia]